MKRKLLITSFIISSSLFFSGCGQQVQKQEGLTNPPRADVTGADDINNSQADSNTNI